MPDNNKNKDIELRSEKVRNIVGKVPPLLLRVGISIVSAVIVLVLVLAYFIPCPEYKDITVCLYSDSPVHAKKSLDSGFFHTEFLTRHKNRGEQTGFLILDSDNDSILNTYADISGDVYYQLDTRIRVKKGDILYVIIPDTISEIFGVCSIPGNEVGMIREGQKVSVMMEDKSLVYGFIRRICLFTDTDSITHDNSCKVEISGFSDSLRMCKDKWFLLPNRNYNGKILLSDKPVLRKIMGIN